MAKQGGNVCEADCKWELLSSLEGVTQLWSNIAATWIKPSLNVKGAALLFETVWCNKIASIPTGSAHGLMQTHSGAQQLEPLCECASMCMLQRTCQKCIPAYKESCAQHKKAEASQGPVLHALTVHAQHAAQG